MGSSPLVELIFLLLSLLGASGANSRGKSVDKRYGKWKSAKKSVIEELERFDYLLHLVFIFFLIILTSFLKIWG